MRHPPHRDWSSVGRYTRCPLLESFGGTVPLTCVNASLSTLGHGEGSRDAKDPSDSEHLRNGREEDPTKGQVSRPWNLPLTSVSETDGGEFPGRVRPGDPSGSHRPPLRPRPTPCRRRWLVSEPVVDRTSGRDTLPEKTY